MKKKLLPIFLGFLFACNSLSAQITVNNTPTATQLANILAGSNLVVSNATLTGSNSAKGSFLASNNNLGMTSGVILSTGNVSTAPGPNSAGNTSNNLGTAGTAQMTALAGVNTFDAMTLEFDFTVQSDNIQFNYVFASEEYPEFVGDIYNDVFAFFISGPGITGSENIALIPGTTLPVTINNVNAGTNSQFYVNNTGGQDVSFDAYTTLLTAQKTGLFPCNTYHLKLVIADAGDAQYNSAVFLQENSLVQGIVDVSTNTISANDTASEGCVKASFTFGLDQPATVDKVINFQIAGTATNGIDYALIANTLTIPAGQTSAQVFIDAFSDGIPEGIETVYIIYKPEVCAPWDTAKLYIRDNVSIIYTIDPTDLSCNGNQTGQILVNASGGFPPYTYHIKDDAGIITQYTNNPITGLDAGTYIVYVYDIYGCKAEAQVVGGLFNAGTTFLPDGSGVTYTSTIPITGFSAGQTLTSLTMLQNLCLSLEHSYLGDLGISIIAPGGQSVILKSGYNGGSCDLGEPIATGPVDGSAGSLLTDPGVGYDYCFNSSPMYGTMGAESGLHYRNYTDSQGHNYSDYYLPAGSYTSEQSLAGLIGTPLNGNWTIQVIDNMYLDNGYLFNWTISFVGDLPDSIAIINEPAPIVVNNFVTNATCGTSNGAINISVSGSYPAFTYLWSNGATTEDISNILAGSYTVTVSDNHACTKVLTFNVSNNGTLDLTSNITPITCSGANVGAIDITPSGGQTPYTYLWNNAATTQDISLLAAGTYTVSVTDQNLCVLVRQFEVTANTPIQINQINLSNENCGTQNGAITVIGAGGSGSFGYHWNNGANTAAISGLTAGAYTVTVTDAYSCTATHSYSIINDVSNCVTYCYLNVVQNSITPDMCGNGVGAIDVSIANATLPYVVNWSNGATTEDISGLAQGSYTITVTDANQCVKVETINVGNNTGTLAISNFVVTNETCGSHNGLIDITPAGGALPYNYLWSNGATTQDLSNVVAGNYSVQLKDANNCILTNSYNVLNNAGNLVVTATIINEVCGADNGRIIQTVSGGFGTISYQWSNGATVQTLNNIPAGNYSCTITDAGGCLLIKNYTVQSMPGNLVVNNIVITNENCGNNLGSINLTVSGTAPQYLWSNGATTEDISSLNAGTYSCTVSNNQGCTVLTGALHVFDAPSNLVVTTHEIIDELCGNNNASVTVNVTGGLAPYTFHWSNGSNSQNIYTIHAGTYSLTVTDFNGCQANYSCVVDNSPGTLVIQNAVVTNENCGNSNGAISLIVNGGTLPYTYLWSNSATTQNITGISAGNYNVTVTSANGCVQTENSVVINNANGMTQTWQITNELCSNVQGAIDLTVNGGNSPIAYLWSNGATTQDLSNIAFGNYSCTITDNTSCHSYVGPLVVNNTSASMSTSTSVTNIICGSGLGAINLTVTGGANPLTYLWSNGATTEDLSSLAAGTYSYTVSDVNNCKDFGSATVTNNSSGNMSFTTNVTNEQCNSNLGAIDNTITGGATPYTYFWSNAATTEDLSGLNNGNYSCTITGSNGCVLTTGIISVDDVPGTLVINSIVPIDAICGNNLGKVNITVSGGTTPYTYLWSNGATTQNITGLAPGIFVVTVTGVGGCTVVGQATVYNDNGAFNINNYIVSNEHCSNHQGGIDISVQGGTTPYTYSWSNASTTQDISNLVAGGYSVYVHDALGCFTNGSYTVINQGSNFQISNVAITHGICGNPTGSINITPFGGTTPYQFIWSNGMNTEDISNLSPGTYTVNIVDANGCTTTGTYTVNNLPGTMVISGTVSNEYCGNGQGNVILTLAGGDNPYSYNWSNSSTSQNLSNIHAGTYTATITDNLGCTGNFTGVVNNITNGFAASINTITNENCGNQGGAVDINVSGGNTPYSYLWSNGETTEDISNISSGNFTVTVSDLNGCSVVIPAVVTNNAGTLVFSFENTHDEECNNHQGFIDIQISGGANPYSYLWSNGETTQDLTGLSTGAFSVTVTDGTNCHIISNYQINNTSDISSTGITTNALCTGNTGAIDISFVGGITPITYLWSDGSTTQDLTGLAAGDYAVTVTDAAGCSNSQTYTVFQQNNPNLLFTNVSVTNDYCGGSSGSIWFDGTGSAFLNYYLDNVNIGWGWVNNLNSGTYLLSLIDENGCRIDSSIYLGNDTYIYLTSNTENETCSQGNGSASVTTTATGVTYNWSNGATTSFIGNLNAGTYYCTVSDGFCSQKDTVVITNEFDFTTISTVGSDYCGGNSGSIDLTITGVDTYQYQWNTGETTQDLSGIATGNYQCTVTNNNSGCVNVLDIFVPSSSSGVNLNTTILPDTCNGDRGSITNIVFGGSGNYSYTWDSGQNNLSLNNITSGTYVLTVTDNADNCHLIMYYTVPNIQTFHVSSAYSNATCGSCSNGSITLTPTNNSAFSNTFTYLWSNGATTQNLNAVLPGNYSVYVSTNYGCDTTLYFTISYPTAVAVQEANTTNMEIAPNPANDNFMVLYTIPDGKEATLLIIDMNRKEVYRQAVAGKNKQIVYSLNLAPGVYNVEIFNEKMMMHKKLVIVK